MTDEAAKPSDVTAQSGPHLIRICLKTGGIAFAVCLFSGALEVATCLFDKRKHLQPGVDVLIVHGTAFVSSLLLIRAYHLGMRDAGFQLPKNPVRWFSATALIILLNLALAGIVCLFHPPGIYGGFSRYEKLFVLCLCVPFVEELFFRGWFQAVLFRCANETRPGFAVLGSAAFFAAMHIVVGGGLVGTSVTIAGAFLLGLIAARLRQESSSLLPAVFVHTAYNLTGLFLANPVYSHFSNVSKL